jgi:hypothetical protein
MNIGQTRTNGESYHTCEHLYDRPRPVYQGTEQGRII